MVFPPVLLLRKRRILKRLTACNAFSEESAVTLKAAGVFNPDAFKRLNKILVTRGILGLTPDGRYYVNK